ncbi:MAG: HlyD family type I secretion periplasmic adaptor subunit, partial [Thiovulaceae bacterium]|nr:HlyD family type I secretion periplasmic adaptor subunit [Sulfurimonadaceae bacterium]
MENKKNRPKLTASDFEFVSNVRSAVLIKSPKSTQQVLWAITALVLWFIIWANIAEVDEITRGDGKVIPSGELQMVQNLEGGIVKELLVHVGDTVTAGQSLIKIDNTKFTSSFAESKEKILELEAKAIRLNAEAKNIPFVIPKKKSSAHMKTLLNAELSLYK